ncbi:Hypothetical protein D9617_2g059300 [Elsinoe fawcettii]|nr:Hypothetical protein D9617_2g059300 [Elsinoe fawcettii]
MSTILRDWFLPEDGIRREVISGEIQSFLGNDATVRPGTDDSTGRKVKGYWIRAYRNLTTNMISDLQRKSAKWDQESKRSGKRGSATPEVGPQNNPDHDAVNYEDSRTFREQGGRYDSGKQSPRVEVAYNQTPASRHGHPDTMDYEPSRPVAARPDPHSRAHLANTGAIVGSYGEPIGYAPSRSAPPHVMQGNEYIPDPGYHSSRLVAPDRSSPQHVPGYGGHPSSHSRDVDMIDPRYPPPREEVRYAPREDPRYSHSREDIRYAPREDPRYAEDPRHRSTRDDPRYAPPPSHSMREDPRDPRELRDPRDPRDPRYAASRDHHRDDPRYQSISREDPRLAPVGYQEPPHPASYAPPPMIDQYGRPIAYPPGMPPMEQPVYPPQPPSSRMDSSRIDTSRMDTSRMETQYSNSSRKRGAPPDDSSRHGHHSHGRMR